MAQVPSSGTSLSHMAAFGRKFVIYGAIIVGILIFGRWFLTFAARTYRAINPPPTPAPTMGFGRIPAPAFPTQLPDDRPDQFELGTVGNQFPSYGTQIAVYFMPSAQPNLLALDRAKEKAAALEFVFAPEKVSTDIYRWRRSLPLPATLEIDIINSTINMNVDWASSVTLLNQRMIPSEQQVTTELRTILRSIELLQPDTATATPRITYVKALAGELRPVSSVSEADFVQADLFRNAPQDIPTVTSKKQKGVIQVLFSGSRNQGERILNFQSQYYPVSWANFHTYPLQSARQAFQSLQAGGGYISSPIAGETAVIRTIYLAYFEPSQPQNYYQPVYVFEGDNGFQALVPALNPQVFTVAQ